MEFLIQKPVSMTATTNRTRRASVLLVRSQRLTGPFSPQIPSSDTESVKIAGVQHCVIVVRMDVDGGVVMWLDVVLGVDMIGMLMLSMSLGLPCVGYLRTLTKGSRAHMALKLDMRLCSLARTEHSHSVPRYKCFEHQPHALSRHRGSASVSTRNPSRGFARLAYSSRSYTMLLFPP